jgi:hypothetical protein
MEHDGEQRRRTGIDEPVFAPLCECPLHACAATWTTNACLPSGVLMSEARMRGERTVQTAVEDNELGSIRCRAVERRDVHLLLSTLGSTSLIWANLFEIPFSMCSIIRVHHRICKHAKTTNGLAAVPSLSNRMSCSSHLILRDQKITPPVPLQVFL